MKFCRRRETYLWTVCLSYIILTVWLFSLLRESSTAFKDLEGGSENPRTSPAAKTTEPTPTTRTVDACLSWCRKGTARSPPYFLTAVLLVRIYASDLARLSTRELWQWLHYLQYAGVEHVYVYDAYHEKAESQRNALEFWITERFVTYVDWSHNAKPYSIEGTQERAYQDCIDRQSNLTTWQTSIDMDEYPFSPIDTKPGFMVRFLQDFTRDQPYLGQLSMQNFLFLGKPLNDTEHPILIDRLRRRTKTAANNLVKPIYQPRFIREAGVHHHVLEMSAGKSEAEIPANLLRMNHYWGARLQNWGDDTDEILAKTQVDHSVANIVASMQKCDVCLPG